MATVLQKIVENHRYCFVDEEMDWKEAIRRGCIPLVEDGCVDPDYYKQIIECVEKYGPYIVFDDYVAMPHTQENAEGVKKTSVGLMISKKIVDFGEDEFGDKKEAKLFFTLAACNPSEHIDNIVQLTSIFTNVPLLEALQKAESGEDILKAEADFPCEEEE